MKKFILSASALVLCISLFFAACASADTREAVFVDISGDWILSSIKYDFSRYDGYAGAQQYIDSLALSGEGASIVFSADKSGESDFAVYGFSGVNSYSGFVSFSGERLVMENPPAVTLAAGPAKAERFERFFLQALHEIAEASLLEGGDVLVLSGADSAFEMAFRRFRLEGTSWNLSAYNSGRAIQSVRLAENPSLAFSGDGRCTGSTGVNRMTGTYSSNSLSRSLSFSPIATTRMGAPNAQMAALEALFLQSLERVASYRISASSLTLISSEGESLLVFSLAR